MWVLLGSLIGWSWVVWLILLIIIIAALWVFTGGQNRQFIGLAPLAPPAGHISSANDPTNHIDDFTRARISQDTPSTPSNPVNHGHGIINNIGSTQYRPTSSNDGRVDRHDSGHNINIPATGRNAPVSVIRNNGNGTRSYDFGRTTSQLTTGLPVIAGFQPQTPGPQSTLESDNYTNYPPTPLTLRTPRAVDGYHPVYQSAQNNTVAANNVNYISLSSGNMADQDICTGRALPESYNIDFNNYPNPQDASKFECACRQVLEQIYGVKFTKEYPPWLHGKELDGAALNFPLKFALNGEIVEYRGLAFEANGIQHYQWPNFTGQSQEEFLAQVRRDQEKLDECDDNGIYVITIPYTVTEHVKGYELIPRWIEYYMLEAVIARKQAEARGETVVDKPPAPLPKVEIINQ